MLEKKVYTKDQNQATQDILQIYQKQKYAIVNFLYFFNFLKILEKKDTQYMQALNESDFVLPDGIALRLFFNKKYGINLENLNGTDFIPFFLDWLQNQNTAFQTFLYGADQKTIQKVADKFSNRRNISYFQDGFSPLNWQKIQTSKKDINILLIGTGTPKQEVFLADNIEKLKEKNLLAFAVGGLFDFLGGREKRAPEIIRKANLEWLRRATTNPSKNLQKTIGTFKLFYYLFKK